jgi:hypothetical protein
MADAARDLARQKRRREDPPPRQERNGAKPGKWKPNAIGLPVEDPCPVVPLGTEKVGGGIVYHLLDSAGHFVTYGASDFSHAGMQSLFAATPFWPQWAWPRYGRAPKISEGETPKEPPIKSFEDDAARQALMLACTRRGLFTPTDKLRGRGMWLDKSGDVIFHAGEELWRFDRGREHPVSIDTGLHEGFLYPRYPGLPAPWPTAISAGENPARALIPTLRKWNWTRPKVDPILMLGWIGVAYLGGALDWRSAVLLLGGFGTGKSTLQDALKALFGEALFHSADTTAAGIYQQMSNDTRPIAIDELEPEADARKVDNVVHLMRGASSGAVGRRGSSGGEAAQYQMRSAFLFSAINNPLHASQDLSRVAILRLGELRKDQTSSPVIDADSCGRMILALLMREWHRFEDTRQAYMEALAGGGHIPRGQKTYGTLLACADLILGADVAAELEIPLTEDLAWWSEHLSAEALPEIEDALPNWRKCVRAILSSHVEQWRGGRRATVGQLLEDVRTGEADVKDARRDLAATGLGLCVPGEISW